jgi:two-component system OmpR family response regulator
METELRLLLVEDDDDAVALLTPRFESENIDVTHAANGVEGYAAARSHAYDVLVIDRMMPQMNGTDMVAKLRGEGITTPVLFLSAMGEVDDRVAGFEAGGDDYLTKPYAFAELLARVTALAKRGAPPAATLHLADLSLDLMSRKARRADKEIELNGREFTLLEYLLKHQGQVVTRTMLLENVWQYSADIETNVVDVHISRLRAKIDRDFDIPLLHTLRGRGFSLKVEA